MPNRLPKSVWSAAPATLISLLSILVADAWSAETDRFKKIISPAIHEYCAKCHGAEDEVEGGVNLLELRSESLSENVELVRSLIDVLDLEAMPPEAEPPRVTTGWSQVISRAGPASATGAARSSPTNTVSACVQPLARSVTVSV